MEWTPGGTSGDIEDRRDDSGVGGGGGFGGMGGGGLGIGGFLILLVLSAVFGRNFLGGLIGGGGGQSSVQTGPQVAGAPEAHPAGEDRDVQLISFVLDDAQKTWTQIFANEGKQYRHAKLVLYRDQTHSGCGTAQSTTGPFYCPEDEKIYIDLGFWDELKHLGGSTADFAQAYVVTHELGHHVQKLLGIESRMQRLTQRDPAERNPLSVDLELQADCFSGVWAHSTEQRNIVHEDDVTGALKSAAAVGDDRLQQMAGKAVSPESWTHGSSAERTQWFETGLAGGTIESCATFNGGIAP